MLHFSSYQEFFLHAQLPTPQFTSSNYLEYVGVFMMIHSAESRRLFIPGEKIVLLLIVSYQMFYCPNIKIPEATGNDEKPFSCSCLTKNSQRETLCKCSISTTRVRQLVIMNNHSAARVVTRNLRRETF